MHKKSADRRILFVTYGGGHVKMVLPVARHLMQNSAFDVQILGLTTAGPVLAREGLPHFGFAALARPEDAEALGWGRQVAEQLPAGPVPSEESAAYLGLSFADLAQRLGAEEASRRFAEVGRQAFLPVTVMKRLLAEMQPDVVVATNSPRAEQAAILAARELGIPAVCLVDLFAIDEVAWIGQPGYADRVCVITEYVQDRICAAGRRREEVVVTGNPAFDALGAPDLRQRAEALRTQNAWGSRPVVLWASQPEPARHPFTGLVGAPELPRHVDACLVDIATRHPDWQIVLRAHPSEQVSHGELPANVTVSQPADDLAALLAACDVLITMSSTAGFEAALVGKPLVSLRMSVTYPGAPYDEMGLALGIDELSALENALSEVISGAWRPAVTLEPPGRATEIIATIVAEIAVETPKAPNIVVQQNT